MTFKKFISLSLSELLTNTLKGQSIREALLRLFGVGIGLISMVFIYPLNHELYGYFTYLYNTALLVVPIISFGIPAVMIHYFYKYKAINNQSGLFIQGILLVTILAIGLAFVSLLLTHYFKQYLVLSNPLLLDNIFAIIFIGWLVAIGFVAGNYYSNFGKIAVPTFFKEITYRLFLPTVVLLSIFLSYQLYLYKYILVVFLMITTFGLILYGIRKRFINRNINVSKILPNELKSMSNYAAYNSLSHLGAMMAFRIDAFMISSMLSLSSTGVYFNVLAMNNVIDIPNQSLQRLAGPKIAVAHNENDIETIGTLYKQISTEGLVFGVLLTLLIWFNLDHLFAISSKPEAFDGAKSVFLVLAVGKLFDIATSTNTLILTYTSLYRLNLYITLLLAILNVTFNLYFIEKYGLLGAALATTTSIAIYNFIKFLYIKYKMGIHPFSIKTIKLTVITFCSVFILSLIPDVSNPFFGMAVNTFAILFTFIPLVYWLRVSSELNKKFNLLRIK